MKPPKDSKKVFSGILFDVYQWQQKVYDGSLRTFEMLSRQPTVDVIALTEDQKILTLIQEQPTKPRFPSLPGGRIEKDQTPLQAAKEELHQETGYKSEDIKLIETFFGTPKLYFPEFVFVAKNCEKVSEQSLDGGEKIEVTFRSFNEFLQLCREPKFTVPLGFKFMMYEALVDSRKREFLKKKIFN